MKRITFFPTLWYTENNNYISKQLSVDWLFMIMQKLYDNKKINPLYLIYICIFGFFMKLKYETAINEHIQSSLTSQTLTIKVFWIKQILDRTPKKIPCTRILFCLVRTGANFAILVEMTKFKLSKKNKESKLISKFSNNRFS